MTSPIQWSVTNDKKNSLNALPSQQNFIVRYSQHFVVYASVKPASAGIQTKMDCVGTVCGS
jgi:hypothetical protein